MGHGLLNSGKCVVYIYEWVRPEAARDGGLWPEATRNEGKNNGRDRAGPPIIGEKAPRIISSPT